MNNTINVGGMTGYYNSFIQSVNSKNSTVKRSTVSSQNSTITNKMEFMSAIDSKIEAVSTEGLHKADNTEAISTKEMTLEEYKKYIHDKISEFPMHSDLMGDYFSIHISDEGFKAMKDDPEYEKWVLQDIKTGFSTPLPGWARSIRGTEYIVANYGATKEQCSCSSWSIGYQGGIGDKIWEKQSKGDFWNKRGYQKKAHNQINKRDSEKRDLERKQIKDAEKKRQAYTEFLNSKGNYISKFSTNAADSSNIGSSRIAEVIAAYENGIVNTF